MLRQSLPSETITSFSTADIVRPDFGNLEPDGDELLHTLAVYYLDADGQVKTTADQLYLHRNTVKYRLGKIRDITNFDAADSMSAYLLYKAIACWRLDPEMGE